MTKVLSKPQATLVENVFLDGRIFYPKPKATLVENARTMLVTPQSLAVTLAGLVLAAQPALAQRAGADNRIENQIAVFAALDKVTARISKLEIPLGETVKFGALTVTPRSCYTRSPLEPPKTTTFVEVTERQLDGAEKKLFSGWMFAESPGLNAVEHPVYDVWLTDCGSPRLTPVAAPGGRPRPGQAAPAATAAPVTKATPGSGVVRVQPGTPATPAAADPKQPIDPAIDDFKRRRPPR